MNLFSEIGMGNFDARAEVISRDEIGEMANSLNAMLDKAEDPEKLMLLTDDEIRKISLYLQTLK